MAKKYTLDWERYIGSHEAGQHIYIKNDTPTMRRDTGINAEEAGEIWNMNKGESMRVNGKTFTCVQATAGKSNGYTRHEKIVVEVR